jgi:hypothetical protein
MTHAVMFAVALLVSFYQAYRGYMLQLTRTDPPFNGWKKPQKVVLLAVADGFFYLVTTLSGFAALAAFAKVFHGISDPGNIAGGTAALLVFLAIYAVLGITAQLPMLIQQGKLLPKYPD